MSNSAELKDKGNTYLPSRNWGNFAMYVHGKISNFEEAMNIDISEGIKSKKDTTDTQMQNASENSSIPKGHEK